MKRSEFLFAMILDVVTDIARGRILKANFAVLLARGAVAVNWVRREEGDLGWTLYLLKNDWSYHERRPVLFSSSQLIAGASGIRRVRFHEGATDLKRIIRGLRPLGVNTRRYGRERVIRFHGPRAREDIRKHLK